MIWLLMKILDIDMIFPNKKIMHKNRKLSPESVVTLKFLNWANHEEVMKYFVLLQTMSF